MKVSTQKLARRRRRGVRSLKPIAASDERLMQIILAPHVSEKGTRLADKHRQISFAVRADAAKPEIRQAVEKLFSVKVETVTVANVRGKRKQTGRIAGARRDWKKAFVRLAPGQDIDFTGATK